MSLKIAIGGDHAGFAYKEEVKNMLAELGHEFKDFGPHSEESCDYPDYVHPLAQSVEAGTNDFGIIICGSGNGVNMVANKYKNIRSALIWQNELAELSRGHNDANVIAIPARFISLEEAKTFIKTFLDTPFEGGRHERRVQKISC